MEERIPRQWLTIARRGAGKSTLAAAMSPEYLVCDLDGRWAEQKTGSKSHIIRQADPLKLARELEEKRLQLQSYVNTVIVDSGTAILDYMGAQNRLAEAAAKAENRKHNNDEANKLKADTLRLLRLSILRWQCDYMWIFHIEDNMKSGKEGERTTISRMEIERMKANLNAVLTIVQDPKGTRGIRVEWSRYNNDIAAGQIIWDVDGMWKGVPEKVDVFLQNFMGNEGYNGLSYSGEWLFKYLGGKGVQYQDVLDMYTRLDVKEEPFFFDRAGWGGLIKKAMPETK